MSSSQELDHNLQEEEEKDKNSLFQTEIVNPLISSSEQTMDKEENEVKSNSTVIIKENNENSSSEKEKNENKDENQNTSQDTKIESDLIKNVINVSCNDSENINETNQKNKIESSPSKIEDQNQNLAEVVISINEQLTQDHEEEEENLASSKSKKKECRAKTSNANRNKNKRYSYLQEINSIPDSVKYNKYVESRYELYTGKVKKAPKIPKAAKSKKDYNAKEIPQLDELTQKLLDGDEEIINKIKNSRKINPNLNNTTNESVSYKTSKTVNSKNSKQIIKKNIEKSTEKSDNNLGEKEDYDEQTEISNDNKTNNEKESNDDPEENSIANESIITEEEEENYENKSNNEGNEIDDDDNENLPTINDLKRTAGQLREYERVMISKGNYADAKNASLTLKMVNKEINKQQSFSKNKGSIEQLVSKRNELKALLNSTAEEFDNMIIDHEQNTISKLDEIALQQKQELEEFDKNIPKDLPPLFKRNSVSYLKMRSKEKYLAITRNFDEAMNLQKKADVIEKEEEQLNFEKMDSYYRDKRNKLIIKQRNAIENYIQYSDMRKGEMLNLREVAIRGTTNRIRNLETQIRIECNKRGIKQSEINYDIVDNERIELIKSKENENPISSKRAANSKCQRKSQHNSTAATSTSMSPTSLSKRNSVTNSRSSISSINSQSKRKSSLSSNKPRIKTPSSLSNSPLSSSVGSKRPNKPKKTAINVIQNDIRPISPLNKDSNPETDIDNKNQKSEIGVNAKLEDELKNNAQILNSEINENSQKKD